MALFIENTKSGKQVKIKKDIQKMIKKLFLFMVVVAIVSCGKKEHKEVELNSSGVEMYSENSKPIFVDDGELDKMYREQGLVYTKELETSAANNDIEALKVLANMYSYGICGVEANRKKAYVAYRKLAEMGDVEAMGKLGYMLLYGLCPIENAELGLEWLAKAANGRDGFAFMTLGYFFDKNLEPTEGNKLQAKIYYQEAVKLGYNEAEELLKEMK